MAKLFSYIFRVLPVFYIMLYLDIIRQTNCQTPCTGSEIYGRGNEGNTPGVDGRNGTTYILLGTFSGYEVDCCGVADTWRAEINPVGINETVYFQIWRPQGGGNYQLVRENAFLITGSGLQVFTAVNKISIVPGDRIGWYTTGANMIEHRSKASADATFWSIQKPSQGDIITAGASNGSDNSIEYGIRMIPAGGSIPAFTSPVGGSTFNLFNDDPVGTFVARLVWSDADAGDNVTATMDTSNTKFAFNSSTGEITVASSLAGPTVTNTLSFTITDSCGNTASLTIKINITNVPPVLHDLPIASVVSEDTAGDILLYTINATDTADAVTCNFEAPITDPFSIRLIPNSSHYGLYVDSYPNFNYNTQNRYDLTIVCNDGHVNSNTGDYFVYIKKNQAPVITNLQAATVLSTTATMNTDVFRVLANDAENDTLTFSMVCDPSPCPFEIRDSGHIQLVADISSYTTTGYDLNITVSDGRNTVGPKILTVIIKDINDPVLIVNLPTSTYAVPENSPAGRSVFKVLISDQDNQTWTYSMSSTPVDGLTYFSIDSSGVITTSGSNLNYEQLAKLGLTTFTFIISVNDGRTTDIDPLVIEITNVNEAPVFSQNAYSISGSEGTGVIGTPSFGVSDPDSGDNYTLSMDCGNYTSFFHLNPSSGVLSFQSNYDIDAGRPTTVNCIVTVTDTGGLSDTATLDIYITDIDDNTPIFSPTAYSFFISYYAGVGTSVGTVTATDGDVGKYGVLTYSLDQTSLLDEYFTIDNNGRITLKKMPYGSPIGYATSVKIDAYVTDAGGLTAVAPVTIVISDTTTTSTTTTTDRYRKFIEDNRNVAWLIASCVALAVIIGFLTWILYTCRGENSFANFLRMCCNYRKTFKAKRFQRFRTTPTSTPPLTPIRPRKVEPITVRHPPPPKAQQEWRSMVQDPAPTIQEPSKIYDFWNHSDFTDNRLTKLM